MAIENWTSEDMDWDDISGRLLHGKYLEAIRLALLERLSVLTELWFIHGWSLAGAYYPPEPTWGIGSPIRLFEAITDENWAEYWIDLIIPLYCDTTSADTWDGLPAGEIAPKAWTEATLMAHLGQTRIRLTEDAHHLTAPWIRQQYDILNELRWLRVDWNHGLSLFPKFGVTTGGRKYIQPWGEATWAGSKASSDAAWTATSYDDTTDNAWPQQFSGGSYYAGGPVYDSALSVIRTSVAIPLMHRFAADCVFYGKCEGLEVPDPLNIPAIEVWNLIGTTVISKVTPTPQPGRPIPAMTPTYVYSPEFGDLTKPAPWVAEPTDGPWLRRGWSMTDYAAAVKFDQDPSNGFQFLPAS